MTEKKEPLISFRSAAPGLRRQSPPRLPDRGRIELRAEQNEMLAQAREREDGSSAVWRAVALGTAGLMMTLRGDQAAVEQVIETSISQDVENIDLAMDRAQQVDVADEDAVTAEALLQMAEHGEEMSIKLTIKIDGPAEEVAERLDALRQAGLGGPVATEEPGWFRSEFLGLVGIGFVALGGALQVIGSGQKIWRFAADLLRDERAAASEAPGHKANPSGTEDEGVRRVEIDPAKISRIELVVGPADDAPEDAPDAGSVGAKLLELGGDFVKVGKALAP